MRCMPPALLAAVVVLLTAPAPMEAASAEPRVHHRASHAKMVRVERSRGHAFHRFHRHRFPRFHHAPALRHRFVKRRGHFAHGLKARHGHRHDFFPHHAWLWPHVAAVTDTATATIIEQVSVPAPEPSMPVVPSVTELPVVMGIRSASAGTPTVYVINSGERSLRRGGANPLSMDEGKSEADPGDGGPRIIRLTVPRGR